MLTDSTISWSMCYDLCTFLFKWLDELVLKQEEKVCELYLSAHIKEGNPTEADY